MKTNNLLRESMAQVKEIARTIYSTSETGSPHEDLAEKIVELAHAALAEPVRNCDLDTTKEEAQEAFLKEPCDHPCGNCWVEDINNECGVDWLLAAATEKEGGAK